MILTNILQGKKYGVILMDSPILCDFLFLTFDLDCSDRIFPKNNMWKVALVSQIVQNEKKKSPKETRENLLLTLLFFGYADVMNIRKNLRFYVSARRLLQLASSVCARS